MDSTSAMFDFSNEGDCILANSSLVPKSDDNLSCQDIDLLFRDIEMTEEQLSQLKKPGLKKPKILPFIKIINVNEKKDDSTRELKPKPVVIIGIQGEF